MLRGCLLSAATWQGAALTSHALQVQGSSLRSLYKRSAGRATFTMDPVRDLLIWAVVQNHKELAEIIWAQVSQPRAVGLSCEAQMEPNFPGPKGKIASAGICDSRRAGPRQCLSPTHSQM